MTQHTMSGEEFQAWVDTMRERKLAKNKRACGELLGRSDQWVTKALKNGTDRATALACAALLAELEPFAIPKLSFRKPVDAFAD